MTVWHRLVAYCATFWNMVKPQRKYTISDTGVYEKTHQLYHFAPNTIEVTGAYMVWGAKRLNDTTVLVKKGY